MPYAGCRKAGGWDDWFDGGNHAPQYPPDLVLEPILTEIWVKKIDFEKAEVDMCVGHKIERRNRKPVANTEYLCQIDFDAVGFQNLTVCSVPAGTSVLNGEQIHLLAPICSWRYDGHRVRIIWQESFKPGEERTVFIQYSVKSPVSGLYFSHPNSLQPNKPVYLITDHEAERARYWLPVIDAPCVKPRLIFHITLTSDQSHLKTLTNGELFGMEPVAKCAPGFLTRHFKLDHPCPSYLVCLAIGEFVTYQEPVAGFDWAYHAPLGIATTEDLKRSFGKTPEMITWLCEKLGLDKSYYRKYHQIAAPLIRSAMENIQLVTWSDQYIVSKNLAAERQEMVDCINLHELAHTVFGNLITMNHFDSAYLKEAWATFLESEYLKDQCSMDRFRFEMQESLEAYIEETEKYMRPVVTRNYSHGSQMFDDTTYNGGAWRLHMLREILGEEAFWEAAKAFVVKYKFKTVDSDDFRKCLEENSGFQLSKFFDQWVFGQGFPVLKGTFEDGPGQGKATATFEQIQDGPIFDFSLDVELKDSSDALHTAQLVFTSESRKSSFTFVFAGPTVFPAELRVDPHGRLLFSMDRLEVGLDVLRNSCKNAKDIVSRIRAYRELVYINSPASMQVVEETVFLDSFYGVRIKVAQSLALVPTFRSIEILRKFILSETHPNAMAAVFKACVGINDPRIRDAILQRLNSKAGSTTEVAVKMAPLTPMAHAAALVVLGSQKCPDEVLRVVLPVAEKTSTDYERLGLIRSSAFQSIGIYCQGLSCPTRSKIFDFILQRVSLLVDDHSDPDCERNIRVVPPMLDALVASASFMDDHPMKKNAVIDILKRILSRQLDLFGSGGDGNAVLRSAVTGIVKLKAWSAASFIQNVVRSQLPHQEHSWLERRLRELLSPPAPSPVHSFERRIQILEERLGALEK